MAKHSKNPPTLYDNLMASRPQRHGLLKKTVDEAMLPLKMAHVYVMDEEASAFLGHLLKNITPQLLGQHEFARAPYPNTWIEFDFPAYMKALDGRDPSSDGDKRVGFWINERSHMFCVSETKTRKPLMTPYWFELHQPISFEEELETANKFGVSRLVFRQMLIGTSGLDPDWVLSADAAAFCRSHRLTLSSILGPIQPSILRLMLEGGAGSLKQGIALLLLLTRPGQAVMKLHEQDKRQGIIKGRPHVLASHHKVTLHLHRDMAMHKIVEALHSTGRHNRYHDVRGHWCQTRNPKYRGCDHDWQPVSVNRYECINAGCKAKRWWKSDHHRGDLSLGAVTKTYDVTK
jgi:hypothetical protein